MRSASWVAQTLYPTPVIFLFWDYSVKINMWYFTSALLSLSHISHVQVFSTHFAMYNRIQPKPSTKEWRPWNSFLNKIGEYVDCSRSWSSLLIFLWVPTTNPDQVYYPGLEPNHPYNLVDSENEVKPDRSLMASKWAVKPESPELLNNYDMGYVSWRAVEPESPEPAITEDVNYVSLKALGTA